MTDDPNVHTHTQYVHVEEKSSTGKKERKEL